MFIEELELENFEGIFMTMEVERIYINFLERKNKICLIAGPNGFGKTVLLSHLNPFATLGNMDVRDDLRLILEGKNGHKKIIIRDNDNRYEIDHFYFPNKSSHTVKSYIKKNGEELNPHGNVTSFKERVKEELDIEQDYMKLVRLGNNVSNIIELKGTERKHFMSKILDDANIYLKHHKKISSDVSTVKSIMSHISDKLRKTSITDESLSREMLKKKKMDLDVCIDELDVITNRISVITFQLSEIPTSISSELKDVRKKITKLESRGGDVTLDSMINDEKILSMKYASQKTKISFIRELISSTTDDIDSLIKELEVSEDQLSKILSSIDLHGLENIIRDLESRILKKQSFYDNQDDITYTKENIEDLIVFLKEKQEILNMTYEFGADPVKKVVSLIRNKKDVKSYVESKIIELESQEEDMDARRFVNRLLLKQKNVNIPQKCPGSCFLLDVLDNMRKISSQEYTKEHTREFYSFVNLAYINIKSVMLSFGEKKDLFQKLPAHLQDAFLTNTVLDHISRMEWVYDQKTMFDELTFITEYDNFLNMRLELDDRKQELAHYFKDTSLPFLENHIKSLKGDITNLREKRANALSESETLTKSMNDIAIELDDINALMEIVQKKDELAKKLSSLESDYRKQEELSTELGLLTAQKREKSFLIDKLHAEITSLEYSLSQYKELTKELTACADVFDELNLIRDALSSSKGIPLVFIDLYLKKAKKTVNDLLYQIYRGSIEVKKFNVVAEEFTIPFTKNGKVVNDVIYASQGEKSFFSIALSFAISFQSMSKYNIMLLDELDSVLDESNRGNFISILEKLIEMVSGEQIFVISHNNMFSMYPVDYISVVDTSLESSKLVNHIPIIKTNCA